MVHVSRQVSPIGYGPIPQTDPTVHRHAGMAPELDPAAG